MLLAGRVRKPEEEAVILSILEKHFRRTVNPENLFSQKQVTSQFSECHHFSAFTARWLVTTNSDVASVL